MKLYATIKSERATKGQGGNKYVYGVFSVEREQVGEVELELLEDGEWLLKYRASELMDWEILRQGSIDIHATKGKKQKGECKHIKEYVYNTIRGKRCRNCDENPF